MKKLLYDKGEKSDIARLAQESVRHDEKKLKSGSSIPVSHRVKLQSGTFKDN